MSGFSYKNFMLQIIQGSIISVMLFYLFESDLQKLLSNTKLWDIIAEVLFFILSFFIGVMIDFFADFIESAIIKIKVIKLPSYYLLNDGEKWGIRLAHHQMILKDLCNTAAKNSCGAHNDFEYFENGHKENKEGIPNYIFQVAKNQAFRECSEYQKEQLESFFVLYIFCRNLSFSFLVVILLLLFNADVVNPDIYLVLISALPFLFVITILSSYRYFLYYSRIMLGSTFRPNK